MMEISFSGFVAIIYGAWYFLGSYPFCTWIM